MGIDDSDISLMHFAEMRVVGTPAERVAVDICKRVLDYCLSAEISALAARLTFEGAEAMMTPAEEGLRIRVEACDLVMLHGVRILLQTAIADVLSPSQAAAN